MKHFLDYMQENQASGGKPWLVLGKGPSFSNLHKYDLSQFSVLALNHVAATMPVDFAHAIDIEVIYECGAEIAKNAGFLIMPAVPHAKMTATGGKPLQEWVNEVPALKRLDEEERLLWYDLNSTKEKYSKHPTVEALYFSSEAVLDLLGLCGVRVIRSLGIDGGIRYASEFSALHSQNCLANGQDNFDIQFKQFAKIINRHHLDYASLAEEFPIRIYIGASHSEWLPAKVLEYSIRKHASMSISCRMLFENPLPGRLPRAQENQPKTPFSFQRFLIPELSAYQGKSIYLDSDMLVFQDIKKLWQIPMENADLLSCSALNEQQKSAQYSVMLLDCSRLRWQIDELIDGLDAGLFSYESLMQEMIVVKKKSPRIPPIWNFLDKYVEGSTALLHFTDMRKQPWTSRSNALNAIWCKHLQEAIDCGFIDMADLKREVKLAHVRPSLLYQIENKLENSLEIPSEIVALDSEFTPPYLALAHTGP